MAQIRPGTYTCAVLASYLIPPSEAGKSYQISVSVLVDVPAEDGVSPAEGVNWTYFASFGDASYPTFVEKMLKDLGWDPAAHNYSFDELDAGEGSPLAGKEARAVFQMDEYNGVSKIKLRFLNGPGGGVYVPKERMAPQDAKEFAARMRAKLSAGKAPPAPAAARAPAPAPRRAAPRRAAPAAERSPAGAADALRSAAPPERFENPTPEQRAAVAADVDFDDIPF